MSQLLGTIVEDFEVGLRMDNDAKVEQLAQAAVEVIVQMITEGHDSLLDTVARTCAAMWNAAIMYQKGQLDRVVESRTEDFGRTEDMGLAGFGVRVFCAGFSLEIEAVTQKLSDHIVRVLKSAIASDRRHSVLRLWKSKRRSSSLRRR